MRGEDITQSSLFSYIGLEERVPKTHPLRKMRLLVDAVLKSMSRSLRRAIRIPGARRLRRKGCCGLCCCK
jgi:hypothetical protein